MPDLRRGKSRAETAAETRKKLIDVGLEVIAERSASSPMDTVRVSEVAQRAGLTTGAVYGHWDSQGEYRAELLDRLLSSEVLSSIDELTAMSQVIETRRFSLRELLRVGAHLSLALNLANQVFRIHTGLWAKNDPELNDRIGGLYAEIRRRMTEVYRLILDSYDLEARPPFTVEMFATFGTAMVDGLTMQQQARADLVPLDVKGPNGEDWDVFGLTMLTVVATWARPRGSSDVADLWDVTRWLDELGGQST
ncbi:MAG: hypothetical protein JJLCMIEE_02785 [Acidimicrobiales bacterium]|nr:hypothetical protein [Acidimicrobiales bacterium]